MVWKDVFVGTFIFCSLIAALYLGISTIDEQMKFHEKQVRLQRINQVSELESSTENSVKLWVRCDINLFNIAIPSDIKHQQYNTHTFGF